MICQIRNSKVFGYVWRKSLATFANRRNGYTFVIVCQYRSIVRATWLTSKILVIWSFATHYYHIINWLYGNVSNVCIQITKCINFTKSHSRRSTDYSGIEGRCNCTSCTRRRRSGRASLGSRMEARRGEGSCYRPWASWNIRDRRTFG